jgi:Ankyrin repeats (3 copies)
MDAASVLADAADQVSDNYKDDFDDAEEPAESTVKTSAGDILKSSAIEVAYEDEIDAKVASRVHSDKVSYEKTSSLPSPSKNISNSSARRILNEDVVRKEEFLKYDDDNKDLKYQEWERKIGTATGDSSPSHHGYRADAQNNANYADCGSDDADEDKNDDDDDDEGSDEDGDPELNTALLLAVYHGDIKKMKKLLDSGARYFTRDRHRWTALMWACSGGHDEIVETLLSYVEKRKLKQFLNAKDNITGWTALHVRHINLLSVAFLDSNDSVYINNVTVFFSITFARRSLA